MCPSTTHPVRPLVLQTDSLTNLPPGWNDGTCGWSHNREGRRIIVWLLSQLCSIFRYIPRTLPTDFLEKMLSGWRKEHLNFFFFFKDFDGKFLGWSRIWLLSELVGQPQADERGGNIWFLTPLFSSSLRLTRNICTGSTRHAVFNEFLSVAFLFVSSPANQSRTSADRKLILSVENRVASSTSLVSGMRKVWQISTSDVNVICVPWRTAAFVDADMGKEKTFSDKNIKSLKSWRKDAQVAVLPKITKDHLSK